jgi:AcrR family transcriptional regulator
VTKKKEAAPDPFAALRANQPKQARSRETLSKLLDAAEGLLAEGGIDATTVPAIAERAGVSVGIVYQRFADKDALLRAVYFRYFANLREHNQNNLALLATWKAPLATLARSLILGMVEGYRRQRGILRALLTYARNHPDPEFRRAAQQLNREATATIGQLLLQHRDEIRHPQPKIAIELGILTVAAVLHTIVLEEEPLPSMRGRAKLDEELVRMFCAYVGIG